MHVNIIIIKNIYKKIILSCFHVVLFKAREHVHSLYVDVSVLYSCWMPTLHEHICDTSYTLTCPTLLEHFSDKCPLILYYDRTLYYFLKELII